MKLFQDSHCPTYNLCLSVYVSVCVYILRWKQNYIGILAKRIRLLTQQNYKMSMRMTITSMTTTRTKMTTSTTTATTTKHRRKGDASLFAGTCFFPISVWRPGDGVRVAMCGCCLVWELRCRGVAMWGSCGKGELQQGGVAVRGSCSVWELRCVQVVVCGS